MRGAASKDKDPGLTEYVRPNLYVICVFLNQQKKLEEFVAKYPNLASLKGQEPLADTLFISQDPYNIFSAYTEMNIAY